MLRAIPMLCALALIGRSANAAEPKVILLESYSDARPIGMSHYVAEIIASLRLPGLLAGDALRTKLEASFSRPATTATAEDLRAFVARATDGVNAYGTANFNVAVTQLSQVVDALAREPGALVADSKLRETRKEALLTLAEALLKLHREGEAKAVLAELVRSYPNLEFSELVLPPNVVQVGKRVQRERSDHPRTTLEIVTIPPGRKVFLDEQLIGLTPLTKRGLHPGSYRVYFPPVGTGKSGRYRPVEVFADKSTQLVVTSEIEEKIETKEYVGLHFSSAAQQQQAEVSIACAVARVLGADTNRSASEIILLTRQRSPAADAELMGAIYDVNGHRKWASIVPLAPIPPDDATLARFANSLRLRREVEGVRVAPDLLPGVGNSNTKLYESAGTNDRFSYKQKLIFRVTGILLGAISAGLVWQGFVELHFNGALVDKNLDSSCAPSCPYRLDTARGMALFFSLGVGGLATSVALSTLGWKHWPSKRTTLATEVSSTGARLQLQGSF